MKIGVVFPHDTIEPDYRAIKEYAQTVEQMGFSHIISYDHVINANAASRPDWGRRYNLDSKFHEAISLLSFIAGCTSTIGLATGVMILPQRQTVMVAKQAATLDLLSNGRLRLGVGTGWNEVEYEALGVDFKSRGKIFDEQIDVLRALWSNRAVTFDTPFHKITDAGLYPMPVQQPIPLWLGGGGVHPIQGWANADKVIRRIARKADGWLPTFDPDDTGAELVRRFREFAGEYGRDPDTIEIEALLLANMVSDWAQHAHAWKKLGATRMCINCGGGPVQGLKGNLNQLEQIQKALRSAGLWNE